MKTTILEYNILKNTKASYDSIFFKRRNSFFQAQLNIGFWLTKVLKTNPVVHVLAHNTSFVRFCQIGSLFWTLELNNCKNCMLNILFNTTKMKEPFVRMG